MKKTSYMVGFKNIRVQSNSIFFLKIIQSYPSHKLYIDDTSPLYITIIFSLGLT